MKKNRQGKLFIISAPSGAGKTSLVNEVLSRMPKSCQLDRLVTYTSREMRDGEQEGIDYCFVSPMDFEKKIHDGFFIEWSKAYDHYYGSPKCVLDDLQSGKSRILVIDRMGAKQVMDKVKGAVPVWIYTSDVQMLENRLLFRGKNSSEQIKRRVEIAKQELEEENKKSFYAYKILNDTFDDAIKKLECIFLKELNLV